MQKWKKVKGILKICSPQAGKNACTGVLKVNLLGPVEIMVPSSGQGGSCKNSPRHLLIHQEDLLITSQFYFPPKISDECDIYFYFIFIKVIYEHSLKKSSSQNSFKCILKSIHCIVCKLYLSFLKKSIICPV